MPKKQPDLRLCKKIYAFLEVKERTHAELCWLLKLDYSTKGYKVMDAVDYMSTELGFALTERETENNIWWGVLLTKVNEELYTLHFATLK